jgi:hypothetical protein
LKTLRSNKTSVIRLEIASNIESILDILDITMDSLEESIDFNLLKENIEEIKKRLSDIDSNLQLLNSIYKEYFFSQNQYSQRGSYKDNKEIQKTLMTKKIKENIEEEYF